MSALHPSIDGAYTGTAYAVFYWDDGDAAVGCEYSGASLREARKAVGLLRRASEPFDHVVMCRRAVTFPSWEPATAQDYGSELS